MRGQLSPDGCPEISIKLRSTALLVSKRTDRVSTEMPVSISMQMVVDRIRFHVLVEKTLCSHIWSQFKEMVILSKDIVPQGRIRMWTGKHGQTRLIYQPVKRRTIAVMGVGTTASKHYYFGLDLFPTRFQVGEFDHFKSVLTAILDIVAYEKLYVDANVSYLELAVDSLSFQMGSFLPYFAKSSKSHVHQLSDGTGGIYLGAEAAKLRFCVYDKARQMWEVQKKVSDHKIRTRIEARIHTTGLHAADLEVALPNPFPKLEIADRSALLNNSHHPKLSEFLKGCQSSGPSTALNQLGPKDRRQVLQDLRKARAWWWNPTSCWDSLPKALAVLKP